MILNYVKTLRRLFFRFFNRYRRLELKRFAHVDADRLLRENEGKPEGAQWHIAREEDANRVPLTVWLERRVRITE